jgi:hypothetical protein
MNYFIPLALRIDPDEKAKFLVSNLASLESKYKGSGHGLANVATVTDQFPNTIAQTNRFVSQLGLRTRAVTLFASDRDTNSWAIHADGVYYKNKPTMLEARLSYYEMAEASGTINWWDNMPMTVSEYTASEYSQARINVTANCAEDLRTGKLQWSDIPKPDYSVESSVPSAILRTNIAHNVIQGSGMRITISCQLVFADGNPVGVWDHIQQNINQLGV